MVFFFATVALAAAVMVYYVCVSTGMECVSVPSSQQQHTEMPMLARAAAMAAVWLSHTFLALGVKHWALQPAMGPIASPTHGLHTSSQSLVCECEVGDGCWASIAQQ